MLGRLTPTNDGSDGLVHFYRQEHGAQRGLASELQSHSWLAEALRHQGAPLSFSRLYLLALERIRAQWAPTPAQLYPEPRWGLTKKNQAFIPQRTHKTKRHRPPPRAGLASSASAGLWASFRWLLRLSSAAKVTRSGLNSEPCVTLPDSLDSEGFPILRGGGFSSLRAQLCQVCPAPSVGRFPR